MTQVQIIDNHPNVMSSREIAELTGKRHPDVLRDIRLMLDDLKEDASRFAHIYLDSMNRQQTEYQLNRELTDTLLTGYSAIARRKVIARWHELETKQAAGPDLTTDEGKLLLIQDLVSKQLTLMADKKQVEGRLAIAAPKAEALDRITLSDGSLCITNAAKTLGLGPKRLFAWMQENQWIYRRAGGSGFVGYQSRIQVGYLDHKITLVTRSDGSEKTVEQVLVTPKGLAKLATALNLKEAA